MEDKTTETSIVAKNAADSTPISPFTNNKSFEEAWRMGECFSRSSIVPDSYRGKENIPNCVIALELSNRLNVSPFLVMQNMFVIQGRPSWSAQYLIGAINVSGKFSPLRWKVTKTGKTIKAESHYKEWHTDPSSNRRIPTDKTKTVEVPEMSAVAFATELKTGEVLEGPEVNIQMAVKEGWYTKDGSKWQTMPEIMLRYRSAAFFCRMYCPEVAMGLYTREEIEDIGVKAEQVVHEDNAKTITEEILGEEEEVHDTAFVPKEERKIEAVETPKKTASKPKAEPKPEVKDDAGDGAFDLPLGDAENGDF